jgi:hypothetical protein
MSQFHFSPLFKQSIGTSPYQYLLQQRIERAKQLLKQTDRSIVDIAFGCGFNSHSHLSKQALPSSDRSDSSAFSKVITLENALESKNSTSPSLSQLPTAPQKSIPAPEPKQASDKSTSIKLLLPMPMVIN